MITWDEVRELALGLPEVEEGLSYRRPALRVCGRVFANLSAHVEGALVVKVDPDERPLLIGARPDVYFVTPHYEAYPTLLVRLEAVEADELRERLTDAWLLMAPKRLAALLD